MFSTDIPVCAITSFGMYTYPFSIPPIEFTNPTLQMLNSNDTLKTSIEVDTSSSFVTQLFVYSFVDENIADIGLRLDITVCGLETL